MNNSNNVNREQQLYTWTQIISDCQSAKAAGTKVKDWLKANNISKDTYYYWYREVKDSYMNSSLPEIIPITESLFPESTGSAPIPYTSITCDSLSHKIAVTDNHSCIKFSINGITIEVNEIANPELLTNVIKTVRYA